ncbi:MAG: OsmC family protein [Chloroflexi bacterium]|nr:OsmC family protein [Chloroflexota bacterium]
MKAAVTWDHGLTFTGTADSDFSVNLGGSPAVGGDDDGFRPMELILTGLIGCTAMDVISILQKKRQNVTGFRVTAETEQANTYPKVFTHIHIHYIVEGHNVNPKAVERAMDLSETRYCPAQAMLTAAVDMKLTYEIIEAEPVMA